MLHTTKLSFDLRLECILPRKSIFTGTTAAKSTDPDAGLSPAQRVLRNEVATAADTLRRARVFRRAELEEQLRVELEGLHSDLVAAVRRAYEPLGRGGKPVEGLSKAALRRAIGNSDPATLNRMLEGFQPDRDRPDRKPTPEFEFGVLDDSFGFGWPVKVLWVVNADGQQVVFETPIPEVNVYRSDLTGGEWVVDWWPAELAGLPEKYRADLVARLAVECNTRVDGSGVAGSADKGGF